jgi:hypothetical protein
MDPYQGYVIISVIVLALVVFLIYLSSRKKPKKGLSGLAALAFVFIIAGIVYGEDRIVGYSLLGVGIVLAVIDIYNKLKGK